MNWNLFEYAGGTAIAYLAFLVSLLTLLAVLAGAVYLAWRRKWAWAAYPLPLAALWAVAWWLFGPMLDHAWLYLQENARRSHSTYVGLTFASAFIPPTVGEGRRSFLHVATRDYGFAKGRPVRVERLGGRLWEHFEDEDYPGGVTLCDGMPVDTGYRFRSTRLLNSLIPYFEMPGAKNVWLIGEDAELHRQPLEEAGLEVVNGKGERTVDIVLVAPGADWRLFSSMPDAADWKRIASRLSKGGVAALHIDARLMSRARFKRILGDFRKQFIHYRLWCTGRYDYVLTSGGSILADDMLELFSSAKAFPVFTAADAVSPGEVLACYVGTDFEVDPAFFSVPDYGHLRAAWTAPRLAFSPPPTNHLAAVTPSSVTVKGMPVTDWLLRGTVEKAVFAALTNGISRAQFARREALRGFAEADRGAVTNAVDRWAEAAKANWRDPLLLALTDSLDLEGRRFLRIGNVGAAIQCYENRLLIRPHDVAAVHNFGVCLKKSGRFDIAASVFAKAVTMDPETDEHRIEMVECCAACGKEDIACRQLEVLMKRHPSEPAHMMRAAKLLCLRKNKARDENRAVKLAEEAVRLTGWKDQAYVQSLADVYIEVGRVRMGMGLKKKMKEMRFER